MIPQDTTLKLPVQAGGQTCCASCRFPLTPPATYCSGCREPLHAHGGCNRPWTDGRRGGPLCVECAEKLVECDLCGGSVPLAFALFDADDECSCPRCEDRWRFGEWEWVPSEDELLAAAAASRYGVEVRP